MTKEKQVLDHTHFTADEILDYRFTTSDIGYKMLEVDKFFDDVIADYRFFANAIKNKDKQINNLETQIKKLRAENNHLLIEMNVNPNTINTTPNLKFTRKDELDAQHDTEARLFKNK